MAPRPLLQSWSSPSPPNHSTLQSHPAMAPRPLRQSWSSPSPLTIAHYNGTLQWHPAMAPRLLNHRTLQMAPSNGTTSTPPKLVVTLPPTIAHYNGTPRRHQAMAPRPLHPAMAPSMFFHTSNLTSIRHPWKARPVASMSSWSNGRSQGTIELATNHTDLHHTTRHRCPQQKAIDGQLFQWK